MVDNVAGNVLVRGDGRVEDTPEWNESLADSSCMKFPLLDRVSHLPIAIGQGIHKSFMAGLFFFAHFIVRQCVILEFRVHGPRKLSQPVNIVLKRTLVDVAFAPFKRAGSQSVVGVQLVELQPGTIR